MPPASPLGSHSPNPSPSVKSPINRPSHSPSASTSSAASAAAAVRRRPTLNNGSPKSPALGGPSVDDMERERAKSAGLKALVSAAEDREADALKEANLWRSKADEAASELARMELALSEAQEDKARLDRAYKDLDKAKALAKDQDRKLLDQADEFEASRVAWADEEANLRARLSSANAKLAELEKTAAVPPPETESLPPSLAHPAPIPTPPASEKQQATSLLAALEQLAQEKAAALAELHRATAVAEALRAQMLDLERVNEQLMDDNESYQLLVGERTLMGGFDVKQLMRSEEEDSSGPRPTGGRRSPPSTSSAPSLAGVEEEDEDDDEESEVEQAVLEAHGNGSRTTGAVDAEVTRAPKRSSKRSKDAGLDLAAELAQAEETEADESRRKKEAAERKKAKNTAKDREQEIKALQDANKALVLYISKILDRISAHEGFERVLSSDYSPSRGRSQTMAASTVAATATTTAAVAVANAAGTLYSALIKPAPTVELKPLNLPTATTATTSAASSASASTVAAKRGSWMDFFTGARSPPANTTGIKPLRLGTAGSVTGAGSFSAGLSGGWSGVNIDNELGEEDEDFEEGRARERRLAEMKLHGISDGSESGDRERTIRAMRRSSSVHGVSGSRSQSKVQDERRRMSVEQYGQQQQVYPGAGLTGSPPMTPAEMMKRVEEREKESKKNLEKGQASGFTEIEIRGQRMRPSAARGSSGSGAESPGAAKVTSPGIRDLKMTNGDRKGNGSEAEAEGLLARTARRISMMGGAK